MSFKVGDIVTWRGQPARVTSMWRGKEAVVQPLSCEVSAWTVSVRELGEATADGSKSERPAGPTRKKSKPHRHSKHRSTSKLHGAKSHRRSHRATAKKKAKADAKSHAVALYESIVAEAETARQIKRLSKRFEKADGKEKERDMSKHENVTADQRLILLKGGAMSLGTFNSTSAATASGSNDERAMRKVYAKQARHLARQARTADATSRPALEQAAARALRLANGEAW